MEENQAQNQVEVRKSNKLVKWFFGFLIFSLVGGIFFALGASTKDSDGFWGRAGRVLNGTFSRVFYSQSEEPDFVMPISSERVDLGGMARAMDGNSAVSLSKNIQDIGTSNNEGSGLALIGSILPKKEEAQEEAPPTKIAPEVKECSFDSGSNTLSQKIIFNEIAWMGTEKSASDEWVELKNNSSGEIDLVGWSVKNQKGGIDFIFSTSIKIEPSKFVLLERTNDETVSGIMADAIYNGALGNENEWVKLFNEKCELVDEINASWGWGKFGGENASKMTLERNRDDLGWHTSVASGGTPRSLNSEIKLVSSTLPVEQDDPPSTDAPSSNTNLATSSPVLPPPPSAGTIIITEVMAGSEASAGYEFVEIYNTGSGPVDLTGWSVKKQSSTGSQSALVAASRLEGKIINLGKYLLLAHEIDYTGSVLGDVLWPKSYSLAYTNNGVLLYDSSGQVADQVNWTEIPKDQSYERVTPTKETGFSLQASPNPKNSSM
jgi:hypothetical protein